MEYSDASCVSYLNSVEGIQFDGRSYALFGRTTDPSCSPNASLSRLDPNFKIHDSFNINFQIQTCTADGLLLWVDDPLPESSFTVEIQNRQVRRGGSSNASSLPSSSSLVPSFAASRSACERISPRIACATASGIAFRFVSTARCSR